MSFVLCLLCVMLVPLAAAGLSLIHKGLGRSRSAAHAMLATLCTLAVTAIVFVVFGFSWAGTAGGAAHAFNLHSTQWNWIGAEPFLAHGVRFDGSSESLVLCLQMFTVGLAGIIPISAGTDRWRLAPICLSSALLAGFIYPFFAHWVWGGGWLAQLGSNFSLGSGFVDGGGSGTIQVVGGLTALSAAWILGPRRGKYTEDGIATAIPGHNIVLVLFGCILALVGWIGLNCAGSILFYGIDTAQTVLIVINTMLSASAACLTAVVTTQLRYSKPDASLSANGWIGGLVASSAGCAFVSPGAAILIGLVAGILVTYLIEICELKLYVDDPGGAISVHAGAGLWGLVAMGIFGHIGSHSSNGQLLAQLVGVATLLGCMLPLILAGYWLLNRILPYRVDSSGDWQGMDIRELGAGAYPEFVIHADEFVPR
ncbi:ammonium transporter [Granulicella arctica]|uniref:Amt family ammonium transporter n=1 Tax=Granulicella arctica TaxID=940613 RepID=A0A7Y9PI82_9BACT|nr:ammonium transporter [Granulicella arctica]NYF80326.1 Amt family ammonium transporter [Granulicella arctica]